jgi:NADH-quinone oxidoreductase subunit J
MGAHALPDGFGGVRRVGIELFGDYVLPFELAGVLLLGAILGTIVLARRKP